MMGCRMVLPLLSLAIALIFVENVAAISVVPGNQCGPNKEWDYLNCQNKPCAAILDPSAWPCGVSRLPLCVCKDGFYWQDGECVPPSECSVTCPNNMVYHPEAPEPRNCYNVHEIVENEEKKPRCVCEPEFILSGEGSNECIPLHECYLPKE